MCIRKKIDWIKGKTQIRHTKKTKSIFLFLGWLRRMQHGFNSSKLPPRIILKKVQKCRKLAHMKYIWIFYLSQYVLKLFYCYLYIFIKLLTVVAQYLYWWIKYNGRNANWKMGGGVYFLKADVNSHGLLGKK